MRIKAVLRDSEILKMEAGSEARVKAVATKNVDRPVSWSSLLKVMGLTFDDRTDMLRIVKDLPLHIWLLKDGEQDIIYLSESTEGPEGVPSYMWQ
ncbi:MAG: hypothetical protein DRO87_06700 [Candidatus Thorarchaeota archaeon]|nr:MAG: hypothetical protein DRO87_06700 [Candidatus Thorarchaeota archaeon]RLI58268.1 MAG: hypothetical protein DRP09_00600 [Candidatus Thorarchaeota archaeon]